MEKKEDSLKKLDNLKISKDDINYKIIILEDIGLSIDEIIRYLMYKSIFTSKYIFYYEGKPISKISITRDAGVCGGFNQSIICKEIKNNN